MSKKILLIGGAGYIGIEVTDYLLKMGYKVRCLDSLLYKNGGSVISFLGNPNYEFFFGDFCLAKDLDGSLQDVTDVIILGGLVGDPITKKYPHASSRINDEGILNCLNMLSGRGLNQVIFVSTCSNYGLIANDQLADENFVLAPLSLYAKSKVAAEKFIIENASKLDYSPTILRFATAFGLAPRMRFDLTVNEFTRELVMGNSLLVFDADTWRPYCHVKDFSRLIGLVLEAPISDVAFEIFNAGGSINNFTKQGVVDLIIKYLPEMATKVSYQEQGSDPRNYKVDFSKVERVLGFTPAYTVADGIEEIILAYRMHLFDDVESRRNFYGNYQLAD